MAQLMTAGSRTMGGRFNLGAGPSNHCLVHLGHRKHGKSLVGLRARYPVGNNPSNLRSRRDTGPLVVAARSASGCLSCTSQPQIIAQGPHAWSPGLHCKARGSYGRLALICCLSIYRKHAQSYTLSSMSCQRGTDPDISPPSITPIVSEHVKTIVVDLVSFSLH